MSWIWLLVVVVSGVTAICVAGNFATFGWDFYSQPKMWLLWVATVVAVASGVPLGLSAHHSFVAVGAGSGVGIWVASVLALFMDVILAHDVSVAMIKLRSTRSRYEMDSSTNPPCILRNKR